MRIFALYLLLSFNLHAGEYIIGKVVGVTDGDTITVLENGATQHKVRLEGIDAPESKQDFGQASKKALSDAVFGKRVALERKGRDRYQRLLARVQCDGVDVNVAMVHAGMAWHYTKYSAAKDLADAEKAARKAKRGLWQKTAVPPWEFRKR